MLSVRQAGQNQSERSPAPAPVVGGSGTARAARRNTPNRKPERNPSHETIKPLFWPSALKLHFMIICCMSACAGVARFRGVPGEIRKLHPKSRRAETRTLRPSPWMTMAHWRRWRTAAGQFSIDAGCAPSCVATMNVSATAYRPLKWWVRKCLDVNTTSRCLRPA